MAPPIPAVVLGSALVQTIDFSILILRKDNTIHQPSSSPLPNGIFLQSIIHNLYRLSDLISSCELKKLHDSTRHDKKASKKLSEAALTLLKIVDATKELVAELIDVLILTQGKGTFADPRWSTAREALTSTPGAWKNGDVKSCKKKFRVLRKETDTALLMALRQYLDQSQETGVPVLLASPTSPVGNGSAADGLLGVERQGHLERWQGEALDGVQTNGWKSGKKKNVEEFGTLVDGLVEREREAWFTENMFELLWFEELDERVNSVGRPVEGSFEWVFGEKHRQVGGLVEWLGNVRGEGVFWVTGKPGAGKSTMMKHILRNPRVFPYLESWSGHLPGIISGYFALNTGTALQRSTLGMLRSILYESLQDMIYGPLQQNPDLLRLLFADRWRQLNTYGGGLYPFTVSELRKAFDILVSDTSKKFLFLVDGLDEWGEYPTEVIDLIANATKADHVKFCISSQATPIYQSAFENRPSLFVDDWTKNDIQNYIMTCFNLEPALETLRGKIDSEQETNIITITATKASGVFLYAHIATTYLLQSLVSGDDFLILKDRADALPPQLSDLLTHILCHLDPINLSHIWMIHTILSSRSYPHLLPLSFALTAETNATLAADVRPLKPTELAKRIEDMRSLLHYRCQNLFSIFDTRAPSQQHLDTSSPAAAEHLRVTYTHRAIHTFLLSNASLFHTLPPQTFNAADQWSNSHLWVLKTLSSSPSTVLPSPAPLATTTAAATTAAAAPLPIWRPLSHALSHALTIYTHTKTFPLTYTHAALTTAVFHHLHSPSGSDLPTYPFSPSPSSSSSSATGAGAGAGPPTTLSSALDLALLLNITPYIQLKAKSAEKKELKHALEYSREVRKRWGKGGEEAWLGEPDEPNSALKEEFEKSRTEAESVVEYYAKVTRIGVRKPGGGGVPESY